VHGIYLGGMIGVLNIRWLVTLSPFSFSLNAAVHLDRNRRPRWGDQERNNGNNSLGIHATVLFGRYILAVLFGHDLGWQVWRLSERRVRSPEWIVVLVGSVAIIQSVSHDLGI